LTLIVEIMNYRVLHLRLNYMQQWVDQSWLWIEPMFFGAYVVVAAPGGHKV